MNNKFGFILFNFSYLNITNKVWQKVICNNYKLQNNRDIILYCSYTIILYDR